MTEKYALSAAQMLTLEAGLDALEVAAGRIGRKDWRLLFLGAILSLVLGGLLPPESVHDIIAMAGDGLDHLFGGGGSPPQLPPMPPPELPPLA